MRERALNTVSDPDGGSPNGSGRRGGVLPSRRNRLQRENPPPTRRAPPPAAARPSPAPGPNRRNHAFAAAAGSESTPGHPHGNACCAVKSCSTDIQYWYPYKLLATDGSCSTYRSPITNQYSLQNSRAAAGKYQVPTAAVEAGLCGARSMMAPWRPALLEGGDGSGNPPADS